MRPHLLPRNATPIERAVSLAIDPFGRLAPPVEYLSRVKLDAPDPLLPWLIWEYGLGELLPYLPEPRRAIREGLRWQRLRGTPAALTTALSWIGMDAAVEEEEPTPAHWAEFQLDPGRVLLDAEIDPILAVARLSAPARSRLSRLYHGYDIRHLRLDRSRLDDALLSDYSGSRWTDGTTRLSFGRRFEAETGAALEAQLARLATHLFYAAYADRCLLDVMALSACVPLPNPRFEHGHLYELTQRNALNHRSPMAPHRRYCKAQVVPSEQWALEETNACLPAREWVAGEPFRLGDGLSEVTGGHWREILERFERLSAAAAIIVPSGVLPAEGHERISGAAAAYADRCLLSTMTLSECRPLPAPVDAVAFDHTRSAFYAGQRWVGYWADTAWTAANTLITTSPARRFCHAEIVLSEQWPIGSTNACLPAREWIDGETLTLSEDAPSDTPGGYYAPILERFERLIAAPDPIVVPADGAAAAAHEAVRGLAAPAPLTDPDLIHSAELTATLTTTYSGQRWAGYWADVAWASANTLITPHHTQES